MPHRLPISIATKRLILRDLTGDDLDAVFDILSDEATTAGRSWRQPTRARAKAWLSRRIADQQAHGMSMWAVEEQQSGAVVGLCGFFPRGEPALEIGYVIHARYWGRGFATEAATAAVQHACRTGHSVCATIRPSNRASIRVAEKAGLAFVETIQDTKGELFLYATTPLPPERG